MLKKSALLFLVVLLLPIVTYAQNLETMKFEDVGLSFMIDTDIWKEIAVDERSLDDYQKIFKGNCGTLAISTKDVFSIDTESNITRNNYNYKYLFSEGKKVKEDYANDIKKILEQEGFTNIKGNFLDYKVMVFSISANMHFNSDSDNKNMSKVQAYYTGNNGYQFGLMLICTDDNCNDDIEPIVKTLDFLDNNGVEKVLDYKAKVKFEIDNTVWKDEAIKEESQQNFQKRWSDSCGYLMYSSEDIVSPEEKTPRKYLNYKKFFYDETDEYYVGLEQIPKQLEKAGIKNIQTKWSDYNMRYLTLTGDINSQKYNQFTTINNGYTVNFSYVKTKDNCDFSVEKVLKSVNSMIPVEINSSDEPIHEDKENSEKSVYLIKIIIPVVVVAVIVTIVIVILNKREDKKFNF